MTIVKKILEERAAENLVELDESAEAALAKKSKESGVSLGTLKTVYKRGVAAWNSGHRPGTTPQQWGMARVNSYITKGKGTYHGADKDLREDSRLEKKEYHAGMSDATAKARVAHWKKMDKLSDSDPKSYEPAPGDVTAKTKESKHTKKYRELYGEEAMYLEDLDEQIEWLAEMPGANMDTRAVHQHLKKSGWTLTRTGGGHDIYTHPSAKHTIPVPRHRQLKAPLVLGILKASKIKEEVDLSEAKDDDDSMEFASLQAPGKSTKKSKEDVETTSDYKTDKRGRKYRAHRIVFNKGEEEMKEELVGKQHKLDINKNNKIDSEDLSTIRKLRVKKEDTELDERELTDAEMKERERIVKGMKKSYKDFKGQYGSRGKEVMYATATKLAKEEFSEDILEELEQIEELSKSTLGSYIKKAARSASARSSLSGRFDNEAEHGDDYKKIASNEKLASDFAKDARKRVKGINKATDRLTKEEAEQIDELSKSTLMSYAKKAEAEAGEHSKKSIAAWEKGDKEADEKHFKKMSARSGGAGMAAYKASLKKEELDLDEAIKPYVSGDHASGWSVLDSKGREVKTFHHKDYADHPIADKKAAAKNDAMAYLKKNFSKLSEETLDEMTRGKEYTKAQLMDKIKSGNWEATTDIKPGKHVELRHHSGKRVVVQVKHDMSENTLNDEILLGLCEEMIDRDDFDSRVSAYKKAGYKVLDTKHGDTRAHISFVDSEGVHRTVKYTPTGKSMQNHGPYEGGKKDTSGEKVNKSEVKTIVRGRGRPRRDKFAESVDILLSLSEEEFNEIMEDSSLDEIVVSLCNLSEEELKELKG